MLAARRRTITLSPIQAVFLAGFIVWVIAFSLILMAADAPRLAALVNAPAGHASIDLTQNEPRAIYVRPGHLDITCTVTDAEGRPVPTRSSLGSSLPEKAGDRWVGLLRFDAPVSGPFQVYCSGPVAVAPPEQTWRAHLAVGFAIFFVIGPGLLIYDGRRRRLAKKAGRG